MSKEIRRKNTNRAVLFCLFMKSAESTKMKCVIRSGENFQFGELHRNEMIWFRMGHTSRMQPIPIPHLIITSKTQETARLACAPHQTYVCSPIRIRIGSDCFNYLFGCGISEKNWKIICSDRHQAPKRNLRFNDAKATPMRFDVITDYGCHWTRSFGDRSKNVSGQHLPLAWFVSFALILQNQLILSIWHWRPEA